MTKIIKSQFSYLITLFSAPERAETPPPMAPPIAVPTPGIIDPTAAPTGAPANVATDKDGFRTYFFKPLPTFPNTPFAFAQKPIYQRIK